MLILHHHPQPVSLLLTLFFFSLQNKWKFILSFFTLVLFSKVLAAKPDQQLPAKVESRCERYCTWPREGSGGLEPGGHAVSGGSDQRTMSQNLLISPTTRPQKNGECTNHGLSRRTPAFPLIHSTSDEQTEKSTSPL